MKRKVVLWRRTKHGFSVTPPGLKPKDGEITFSSQQQMLAFARSIRGVLKDVTNYGRVNDYRAQR